MCFGAPLNRKSVLHHPYTAEATKHSLCDAFLFSKRTENSARSVFRRSKRTTPDSNSSLGWVTITHPFHPLSQQRFDVLKRRRVSGKETLIIRHPERGTLAVAQEWTDWEPSSEVASPGVILEFDSLLALAALVRQLAEADGVDE